MPINRLISAIDDNRCQSMTIDNHTHLDDRLFIDYQYQSINWHRLSSNAIDSHRSSISSIGYALQSPRHTKSLNHELKNPCIKVILIDCNSIMNQLTVFGRFKIALFPHILQDRGMFSSIKTKTHRKSAVRHVDFLLDTSAS